MGAADRKIVHDAAQNIEGVTTLSEGEGAASSCGDRPRER
jgi:predicted RNA-binding protein Jag